MSKFVYAIYIVSTPQEVWNALTDGELTRQYWIHSNESDWKAGSPWAHRRSDGSGIADVVGTVTESAPPHRLVMTWAFPADASDPAKVSRVAFDVAEHKAGVVRLTLVHDELESGSVMEQGISTGWPQVLSNLKSFLETGKAHAMW